MEYYFGENVKWKNNQTKALVGLIWFWIGLWYFEVFYWVFIRQETVESDRKEGETTCNKSPDPDSNQGRCDYMVCVLHPEATGLSWSSLSLSCKRNLDLHETSWINKAWQLEQLNDYCSLSTLDFWDTSHVSQRPVPSHAFCSDSLLALFVWSPIVAIATNANHRFCPCKIYCFLCARALWPLKILGLRDSRFQSRA